jgi:DNA-binding ferritin-like protein
MKEIQKQVARARRRMTGQIALRYFAASLLVLASIAVVALTIPKLWYFNLDPRQWYIAWLSSVGGLTLLSTLFLTFRNRPMPLVAAVEVDRRFQLKERLSSALQLSEHDRRSPAGQALAMDAVARAERIDVRDHFPVKPNRTLWWSLLPVALAAGSILVPNAAAPKSLAQTDLKPEVTQIKKRTQTTIEQIRKKREEAEKNGLEDAADMYKQLESELEKMQKDPKLDAKQTLVKLNDLIKQMQERREELGTGESLKKNLQENLKQLGDGPAEKMAKALQDGDMEKAAEEMEKMLDKLKSGEMNREQQERLAKQLDKIEKALQEAAGKHEQAKIMLQEQIKQAEMAGDSQKVAQLKNQMAEVESKQQQMAEMAEMQQSLQEMKEALESGDTKAAAEAMEKMLGKMNEMKGEMSQLEDLEDILDELSDSKEAMKGNRSGRRPGRGDGMGEGQGEGERDEEETDVDFIDSQVRDKMRQGETIFRGKVDGANRKGISKEDVKNAVLSAKVEEADAMEEIVLPKAQREQMRSYFDSMRK